MPRKFYIKCLEENKQYQIYGEVNGFMFRNTNGADNLNQYDFYYKYFNSKKNLVTISGICKNEKHMKEKIEKELKKYF